MQPRISGWFLLCPHLFEQKNKQRKRKYPSEESKVQS